MNGKSVYMVMPSSSPAARSVQDEWGMFDPNQAGLKAAFRAARALTDPESDEDTPEAAPNDRPEPIARETRPPSTPAAVTPNPVAIASAIAVASAVAAAKPVALESTPPPAPVTRAIREVPPAPAAIETTAEAPERDATARRTAAADRGAVYTLEFPTRCPSCEAEMNTVHVSRLLRTQVSFTSTLPRKGYIIVCPHCDGILSAELSGLI
jgi:hypothetical protein